MSDGDVEEKLYVFIGFEGNDAIFLKLTSQTKIYDIHPELLSGCVVYASGQIPILTKPKTIIDVAKPLWTIPKPALAGVLAKEPGRVKQPFPPEFHERLTKAIQQAAGRSAHEKVRLRAIIGLPSTLPARPS